jgi:hypothetical protein
MTEEKKTLYRELLRWAMIDMRMHSASASSNSLLLLLRRGRSHRESLHFINALADWLHNTALYATIDFVGFEETLFGRTITGSEPAFQLLDGQASLNQSL